MWEIAGDGRRQKDNREWMQRERIGRMPLILCRRKEGRRWIEGRWKGRAGGSAIDLGRGGEGAFLDGGQTRRVFVKEREMKSIHMPSVSPVCIRIHIISSAADNLLKAEPLCC